METTDDDLCAVLGVGPGADAEALRAAYLTKVREYPPDREPELFGRVRDAYRALSDPKRKMARYFDAGVLRHPLRDMFPESDSHGRRPPLGTAAWLELLRHAERQEQGRHRREDRH